MDRKLCLICILSVSAVAMMIANFLTPPALADAVVNSRDYQIVSARMEGGSDGLYILDNRTGMLAILSVDEMSRSLQPRLVRPVTDAFK